MSKGIKFDKDKLEWSLLPIESIEEIIRVLQIGAEKYSPENWKKVDNAKQRYVNAIYRHLAEHKKYLDTGDEKHLIDEDTGLLHLACIGASTLFLLWLYKDKFDDITWREKIKEIKEKYKKERDEIKNDK